MINKTKRIIIVFSAIVVLLLVVVVWRTSSYIQPAWVSEEVESVQNIHRIAEDYLRSGGEIDLFASSKKLSGYKNDKIFVISGRPSSYVESISIIKSQLVIKIVGLDIGACYNLTSGVILSFKRGAHGEVKNGGIWVSHNKDENLSLKILEDCVRNPSPIELHLILVK